MAENFPKLMKNENIDTIFIENNPCISAPQQFKSMLFKQQLYIILKLEKIKTKRKILKKAIVEGEEILTMEEQG